MGLRRYVSMNENKRYRLFKLILIFTILNVFGIFLYENILKTGLFNTKPEFYIETIRPENSGEASGLENTTESDDRDRNINSATAGDSILIIGDSNIYLMSRNKAEYEKKYGRKMYWLAESGAGTNMLDDDMVVSLGLINPNYMENSLTTSNEADVIKEISDKSIGYVYVMLGVNSLGEGYAKDLSNKLKRISENTGAKVSYISILPYVDKSKYHISSYDIVKFNSLMKEELKETKIKYIDAYGIVAGVAGYKDETNDGLHYSKKIYDKIFETIMSNIEKAY